MKTKLFTRFFLTGMDSDSQESLREKAKQGDAKAQLILGVMYEEGRGVPKNYKEAVSWFREAAEQGHFGGQFYLGVMCADGRGISQDDEKAFHCFRKAAEQGHPEAQFNLGAMYADGRGVPQNYQEAYKWFSISATLGIGGIVVNRERDETEKKLSSQQLEDAQDEALQLFKKFSQKK